MEHKIGTRITLEVVENDTNECSGCFFDKIVSERCNAPCCGRSDRKNVIYKEIKEE